MRRVLLFALSLLPVLTANLASAAAPPAGWQATLRRIAHNVGGRVTVVDDDTVRVDAFTYDGGGLDVLFYLGADESTAAFAAGLPIGSQLLGTAFTGTQPPISINLPSGATLDGWRAISVWCVDAHVSFGHGTFRAAGDFDEDGDVDGADLGRWASGFGQASAALHANGDANVDFSVDGLDLLTWQRDLGPASSAPVGTLVPEPGAAAVAFLGWAAFLAARRPG